MKLRNKKTGEIINLATRGLLKSDNDNHIVVYPHDSLHWYKYDSLAELCEDWEDIPEEEPEEIYFISAQATVEHWPYRGCNDWIQEKEIGNYFETKEEAERAVEKLKAWKRLKDKGFRFEGWDNTDRSTIHNFSLFVTIEDLESINKDLDLLFGGEDE